jgi:putative peptidoglycan lipid II flippase
MSSRGKEGFLKTLGFTMVITSFIITPCAMGLLFFSGPIISVLFFHGAFGLDDFLITSKTLMAFAPSILPFCLSRSLMQSFYVLGNTLTPVKIGVITLFTNFFCGLILLKVGVFGLAFSISISSTVQFLCLWWFLKKYIDMKQNLGVLKAFSYHLLLALISCFIAMPFSMLAKWDEGFCVFNLIILSFIIFVSANTYFIGSYFFKLPEAIKLAENIKKKFLK